MRRGGTRDGGDVDDVTDMSDVLRLGETRNLKGKTYAKIGLLVKRSKEHQSSQS